MLKKIVKYSLCILSIWFLLTSCGENSNDMQSSQQSSNKNELHTGVTNEETEDGEYILYDRVVAWDDIRTTEYLLQIDDVLYSAYVSLDEIMSKVDSSDVDYQYEYNPNKLVIDNETVKVVIYRDGIEWFEVTALNVHSKTAEAKSCMVTEIVPTKKAKQYCRYLEGKTYEEILSMTYSEVMAYCELKENSSYEEKNRDIDGRNCIQVQLKIKTNPDTLWAGITLDPFGFGVSTFVVFNIDSNSGEVIDFYISGPRGYSWVPV